MQFHTKIVLIVLAQQAIQNTEAFSPLTTASITQQTRPQTLRKDTASRPSLGFSPTVSNTRRKMSQWDDEEEEVTTKPTSFAQAEEDMKKQDDDDKLNSMGDFDENPSVSTATG